MVDTEQRHFAANSASVSRAHALGKGVVQCACERITRRVDRPAEELSASSTFCK